MCSTSSSPGKVRFWEGATSTARVSLAKYFIPGCVGKGLDLDLRVRPAAPAESDFFSIPYCFAGI